MDTSTDPSESSQSPEFVTHNFDAVNEYFRKRADRARAEVDNIRGETRFRRFLAWSKVAPGIALVIVAVGALLVLAGIGWRIANDADDLSNVIAADVKVGSQSVEHLPGELTDGSSDVKRGNELTDHVKEELGGGSPEEASDHRVKGFVIFVYGESGLPAAPVLATGIEYDDSVSFEPVRQWCYLETENSSGTDTVLDLRNWDRFQGHYVKAVTSKIAAEFDTSIAELERLNQECEFVGDGRLDDLSVRNLIERNKQSELGGITPDEFTAMIGTGFFVSRQGHIVTNSHVVDQCQSLVVHHNGTSAPASIVSNNKNDDLAILKTTTYSKAVANLGSSATRPGDDVVAVGYPLQGLLSKELKITKGLVNSLAGLDDDRRMMQISAEVQPGNSGGPLLNNFGQVVGVVTSKVDALKLSKHTGDIAQNVNFAIKGSVVKKHLDKEMIDYSTSTVSRTMTAADIFENAREFTVLVECKV